MNLLLKIMNKRNEDDEEKKKN